jgi:glycosyltransferase involved in cell wall biosynthesis
VIAGDGEERAPLEALVARLGLSDRVTLAGRLGDGQLLDYLARCRAVCFPPLEEDYGFVTAEAFASRKGVITCRDSGGPAELVEDGISGFITEPTAAELGTALKRVMDDRALAERLGAGGYERGSTLSWADAVSRLTS